jgi:hypothetical protein
MQGALSIRGGRIWTGDQAQPWIESLEIRGGRVVAPGDGDACVIDLEGRAAAPGLIDAHVHVLEGGRSLRELDLSGIRSRPAFEEAIRRRDLELPRRRWLMARGWSSENWPGGRLPDKTWLAPAGDRPAVCRRGDLHAALVNDPVLKRLPLRADPPGGRIVRDAMGEPTGLLLEAAAWGLLEAVCPRPDVEERREDLRAAQAHLLAHGVTTAGAMECSADVRDVFDPMREGLRLRVRVTLLDRGWPLDFAPGRRIRKGPMLAVIGYKAFADGTLGSRTARMLADYDDDPGNRGMLLELAADGTLAAWAEAVAAEGLSPAIHAIGDEAARLALDALQPLRDRPGAPPGRVEHAQQVDPSDIGRFGGLVASMQPLHRADDGRFVRARLGERRLAGTFAFRRLLEAGAILAFGSDWPVVSCDPMLGIRAAVTGLTLAGKTFAPDRCLTVEEALTAYTRGSARALHLPDAGRLAPGCFGDLVVFDLDPFTADWGRRPPRVVLTVVGGRVVYDAR